MSFGPKPLQVVVDSTYECDFKCWKCDYAIILRGNDSDYLTECGKGKWSLVKKSLTP
jgi:hypothetical protein